MNPPAPSPAVPGGVTPSAGVGLYIHVPFCIRKCAYCDFCSQPVGADPAAVTRWRRALERELDLLPAGFRPATLHIGGGTPTALGADELARLFAALDKRNLLRSAGERTVEANPGTLTPDRIVGLRDAGVNRISLGVQSFDSPTLAFLGRIHSGAEAEDAFRRLRKAGFDNLGLDLMYAIPGSDAFARDLDRALALGPDHLSAYALTVEDGTPLATRRDEGAIGEVDDETALAQYELLRTRLGTAGYEHYEISNFARPGRASCHNLLYWSGGEYLGCGPSAHSHLAGTRWGNAEDPEAWAAALEGGRSPADFVETLPPDRRARETLVFGLRRTAGVDRREFLRLTGFDYEALCGIELAALASQGMIERTPDRVRLAASALFVSDTVFAALV